MPNPWCITGTDALVLHFADADDKAQLFHAAPGSRAWPYLCYQPSLAGPALGAAPAGQAARKLRLR